MEDHNKSTKLKLSNGIALTISTYPIFMYVKNLLLAKEGIATINPIMADKIIDITEI